MCGLVSSILWRKEVQLEPKAQSQTKLPHTTKPQSENKQANVRAVLSKGSDSQKLKYPMGFEPHSYSDPMQAFR